MFLGYTGILLYVSLCVRLCTKILVPVKELAAVSSHLVTALVIPLQNESFRGYTGISLSVHPCIHLHTKY